MQYTAIPEKSGRSARAQPSARDLHRSYRRNRSAGYNQDPSLRRAEAVKAYLVAKGIDGNRTETKGNGEPEPIGDSATAAGRAQDRRLGIEVKSTTQELDDALE